MFTSVRGPQTARSRFDEALSRPRGRAASPTISRLHEAGLEFDRIRVDLRTKRTESGEDFNAINPKGYVPALVLDDGQLLTENVAILCWVAERAPKLAPAGELGRIRLIEMLAFIATELHKPFIRFIFPTSDAEEQAAQDAIRKRLRFPRGSAARRLPVRQRIQRRRRLLLRHAALGAGEGAGSCPSHCRPSSTGWRRGRPCSWRCSTKGCPEGLWAGQIDPQHDLQTLRLLALMGAAAAAAGSIYAVIQRPARTSAGSWKLPPAPRSAP